MLKYGLKIWSTNKDWFSEAVALFQKGAIDFVEIYIAPDKFSLADLTVFSQNNVLVSLHAPHSSHNFNIFALQKNTLKVWREQVLKTADFLRSPFIVLHAGEEVNQDDLKAQEMFCSQISFFQDSRVLIENMPKIGFWTEKPGGILMFGYSLAELLFIKKQGFGICFDVCHAVASARSQKIDAYEFVSTCLKKINPYYFHLSGANIEEEIDRHFNLWEGNFDFAWFKKQLGLLNSPSAKNKDIYLVFETPKNNSNLDNDIKNISYFQNL